MRRNPMPRPRSIVFVFALALNLGLAAALAAGGCSKNKGTNPVTTTTTTTETFDSRTLVSGTPFKHTFSTAGTFAYHCTFHVNSTPSMTGTVIVKADAMSSAASVSVGSAGNNFDPPSVSITPGGTVTWNLVSGTHTVTR